MDGGHASAARRTIAEGASEADQSQGVFGGVHCACKCQGLSTLSWSSTADDDEGAVRPQADKDGARMATAGGRLHLATAGGRLHLVEDDLSQEV